jgi:adenylate cyclase
MFIRQALLFLLLVGSLPSAIANTAEKGLLDLRSYDFGKSNCKLNGQWLFYWQKFVSPNDVNTVPASGMIQVPGNWSSYNTNANAFEKAYGYGTYLLKMIMPATAADYALHLPNIQTAYTLFINGQELVARGKTGTNEAESVPNAQTAVVHFSSKGSDTLLLLIQVSNFHFSNTSGIWTPIEIGRPERIMAEKTRNYFISSFLVGSLFIMGLYHVALYFMRRRNRSSIYFSISCFCLGMRELFTGEVIFFDFFPHVSWQAGLRILILCFPVTVYAFTQFIWELFPSKKRNGLKTFYLLLAPLFIACVLVFKAGVYLQIMLLYDLIALMFGLYILVKLIIAFRRRTESAGYLVFGFIALIAAMINDLLVQADMIRGVYLLPLAFFIFILFQSLVLASRFTKAYNDIEQFLIELKRINHSYARFVPMEFAKLLNKPDITQVELGDGIEFDMTVLFADLRGFTTISEHLSPQQAFSLLNQTLAITGPLIRKHNGFIDKYIGDGILAVFPSSPADAVKAALEIQRSIKAMATGDFTYDGTPLRYGIGIHTGKLILGIIGEPERIESTVISDTVNTASRVEGLTKVHHMEIIITQDILDKIEDPSAFHIQFIAETHIRGRDTALNIYAVSASE